MTSRRYKAALIIAFAAVWIWAAVNPLDRGGWLLENLLVFFFLPVILIGGIYFRLSNLSYTLIAVFAILHVFGSHYTYAEVPFGYTLQDWLGASRNMYDRLVHFSFGLLLAYPVREVFMRLAKAKGFWGFFFPVELVFAAAGIYEIIEWGAAAIIDPAAGLTFIGAQGDIWDAQKDMLLAGIGAIITMCIVLGVHLKLNRNLGKEIRESLRPQPKDRPLGEEALAEIAKDALES